MIVSSTPQFRLVILVYTRKPIVMKARDPVMITVTVILHARSFVKSALCKVDATTFAYLVKCHSEDEITKLLKKGKTAPTW
jgi:hypothetical protein